MQGVGEITAGQWKVPTLGSPSLSSGTPRKLKGTHVRWPGVEEFLQWAQPFCDESSSVSPRCPPQGAPPLSPSAGRLPVLGSGRRGSCHLLRAGRPGAGSEDAAAASREPRTRITPGAAGGWMRPGSGQELPSGRRWCSPSLTHAPRVLSAPGGRARVWL